MTSDSTPDPEAFERRRSQARDDAGLHGRAEPPEPVEVGRWFQACREAAAGDWLAFLEALGPRPVRTKGAESVEGRAVRTAWEAHYAAGQLALDVQIEQAAAKVPAEIAELPGAMYHLELRHAILTANVRNAKRRYDTAQQAADAARAAHDADRQARDAGRQTAARNVALGWRKLERLIAKEQARHARAVPGPAEDERHSKAVEALNQRAATLEAQEN